MRRGATIRDVGAPDYPQVRGIAESSFPYLRDEMRLCGNADHYQPGWAQRQASRGVSFSVMDRGSGEIAAYIIYQMREDGDVYLRELAAIPPRPERKLLLAGTMLLRHMLEEALRLKQAGRATLNIAEESRIPVSLPGASWARYDPAVYYQQFEYRIEPFASGYSLDGNERNPRDTWMTASIEGAHAAIQRYLGKKARAAGWENQRRMAAPIP